MNFNLFLDKNESFSNDDINLDINVSISDLDYPKISTQ